MHDPTGPDVVYFTLDLERAVNLSHQKEFGDGVIQVSAPTSFLDGNGLEPEPFDINDDISVPYALLPELNTFPRDWASQ